MFDTTPAEVAALAAHDDPAVRRIVETTRRLAADLLLVRLRLYAERYDDADPDAPRGVLLWQALAGGGRLDEDEAREIDALAGLADGWWVSTPEGVELVDLATWREEHP